MSVVHVGTKDGLYAVEGARAALVHGERTSAIAQDDQRLWTTDGRTVRRLEPGGSWTQVAELESLEAQCLLAVEAGVLAGTSEAHLCRLTPDAVEMIRPFDEVEGRDRWYTPWGGPPDTRSLARGPDGTLYANVHVGGVLRSTDGGTTWEPTALHIDTDIHQVAVDPASGLVLAAGAVGLAVSQDRGDSWTIHDDGLHATYLRAVAVADDVVLVSASRGPGGHSSCLYRRPLDGGRFERCSDGVPEWFTTNVDTSWLDASGPLCALLDADGSVYVSEDAGASWTRTATVLGEVECLSIAR